MTEFAAAPRCNRVVRGGKVTGTADGASPLSAAVLADPPLNSSAPDKSTTTAERPRYHPRLPQRRDETFESNPMNVRIPTQISQLWKLKTSSQPHQAQTLPLEPSSTLSCSKSNVIKTGDGYILSNNTTQLQASTVSPRSVRGAISVGVVEG